MANQKLDDMMRKITGLLAVADDPATPPAASDTYREQAEKLMRKYRIEESELMESGSLMVETITPGSKWVDLCPAESPYYNAYWSLMVYVAQHVGCRLQSKWAVNQETGLFMLGAILVGFESDIRFAEVLYTNARLVFADRMEPRVDPNLSDEDNVYRLRSAGIERPRIGEMMGWGRESAQKVTTVYKRACRQRGEDATLTGKGTSVKVFRDTYKDAFLTEFWGRLYKARNAADSEGGGELVLANRKEMVDEAFYGLFPEMRPSDKPVKVKASRKSNSWTKADQAAWERRNSAGGQAGMAAGKKAASEVDVSGHQPSKRLRG